jgi:cell division protein FtsW
MTTETPRSPATAPQRVAAAARGDMDYILLGAVLILLTLGGVMVLSASASEALAQHQSPYYFFERQMLWSVLGLVALAVASRFNYWNWARLSLWLYGLSVVLLLAVLVPHVGLDINGARRWIKVGPLVVQPSELAKLAMVVLFSWLLSRNQDRLGDFWHGLVPHILLAGLVLVLILAEPDLGTTVAVGTTFAVMVFAAGIRRRHIAGLALVALPALAWASLGEAYRRQRLLTFLDPWKHPLSSGFHTIQGLLALGSGGIFGVGLGHSLQAFGYLPEDYTDFIFAIVGEELGLIGTILVIALFAVVAWRGYRIALRAPDTFSALLALGLTTMVVAQAAINIGVVTATLPVTGITLPFISYGGSSLLLSLLDIGVLLNISRRISA